MDFSSVIVITPSDVEGFKQLAEWASQKENWYDIEAMTRGEINAPGDDTRFERFLGDMRCIFSFTIIKSKKALFRHLSISVVGQPDHMPNPYMAIEIAKMLGFTGGPGEWSFRHGHVAPGCQKNGVIVQLLPSPDELESPT